MGPSSHCCAPVDSLVLARSRRPQNRKQSNLLKPVARALVVGEKAMFRQLTNGLINGIFESLNDGPAVVLPALRKLGHSDEGKSSWDGPAV